MPVIQSAGHLYGDVKARPRTLHEELGETLTGLPQPRHVARLCQAVYARSHGTAAHALIVQDHARHPLLQQRSHDAGHWGYSGAAGLRKGISNDGREANL